MTTTHAPNTDPLPCTPSCIRQGRKTPSARWNPYSCGSKSAPPTIRRDSIRSSPGYSLPLSPRLTPESGSSSGQRSSVPTIEEIADSESKDQTEENDSHKVVKKYEYTDDFIDVLLGILSLIYCSPLLIAGGKTFVIPQNFSTQPAPCLSSNQSAPTSTHMSLTHSKPNHMRWFVERLLERTRPPRAVCQLAVSYLVSLTDSVQGELKAAAEAKLRSQTLLFPPIVAAGRVPTYAISAARAQTPDSQLPPPYSALPAPTIVTPPHHVIGMPPLPVTTSHATSSTLLDPRRALLAVMVLAHKFHLDKTWTNKAWSKISGLSPIEVGRCERTVAIALGHRLWRA